MNTNHAVIEPAASRDIAGIKALLVSVGLQADEVTDGSGEFLVARVGTTVAGCVGLEVYHDTAILRSLAVHPEGRGGSLGTRLARAAVQRAGALGSRQVVLLTETAERFFAEKLGFAVIERSQVSEAARQSWQFTGAVCQSATCMMLETGR